MTITRSIVQKKISRHSNSFAETSESHTASVTGVVYREESHVKLDNTHWCASRNGRFSVCRCSAFRHDLFASLSPRCKHKCPTNIMNAHKPVDLESIVMPQFCNPGSLISRGSDAIGPLTLTLRADKLDTEIRMEAPVVIFPKLRGPVTEVSNQTLYEMQGRRCKSCFRKKPLCDLTYDHRVSKLSRGLKDMENVELMCDPCNNVKCSTNMADFIWQRWKHAIRSPFLCEATGTVASAGVGLEPKSPENHRFEILALPVASC